MSPLPRPWPSTPPRALFPFLIGGLVRPDADVVGLLLQFDPVPLPKVLQTPSAATMTCGRWPAVSVPCAEDAWPELIPILYGVAAGTMLTPYIATMLGRQADRYLAAS